MVGTRTMNGDGTNVGLARTSVRANQSTETRNVAAVVMHRQR
jgi:hypothetical protein